VPRHDATGPVAGQVRALARPTHQDHNALEHQARNGLAVARRR
jgi:hypothetical protein